MLTQPTKKMAYKKNYRRRRQHKRSGRSRAKRIGAKAGSMAYTAYKTAMRLKDMINTEYKFYDINNASNPDWTGSLSTLNTPNQGSTDQTRIGDSIKCQNLTLRGYVVANSAAPAFVRMMIIWDPQAKAATTADILEYTGSVFAPFSPKDYDKRFQTRVLLDKVFSVMPADVIQRDFDFVVPIDQHTQFEAGGIGINTGALKILLISNLSANLPGVHYQARLSYTDN